MRRTSRRKLMGLTAAAAVIAVSGIAVSGIAASQQSPASSKTASPTVATTPAAAAPGVPQTGAAAPDPANAGDPDTSKMPPLPSMEGQQGEVISRTAVSAPLRKKREEDPPPAKGGHAALSRTGKHDKSEAKRQAKVPHTRGHKGLKAVHPQRSRGSAHAAGKGAAHRRRR